MKQIRFFLTVFACSIFSTFNAQNLIISPEKPIPGESVMITYDPAGTPLEGHDSILVTAYFIEKSQTLAHDVEMLPTDDKFVGHVKTSGQTKATILSITSSDDEIKDGRNDKGYKFLCYNPDREKPVKGAYASKGMIYNIYYRYANIEDNPAKALLLTKKEFSLYPDSENDLTYYWNYARVASAEEDESALSEVAHKLNVLVDQKQADEESILLAYRLANVLKKEELADNLKSRLLNQFPKGELARSEMRNKFRSAKETSEQVSILEAYKKDFGLQDDNKFNIDYFATRIASGYAKDEDWENFDKYLNMVIDPVRKAGSLNSVAWKLSGEKIGAEAPLAAKGKAFSKQSLELLEQEKKSFAHKPVSFSNRKWKENLSIRYGLFADTYALCAYQTGEVEEALKFQQISCDADNFENAEMNERFAVYYEKVHGGEATEEMLANLIGKGAASVAMKERHKVLFLANNTIESAYDKFIVELEKEHVAKMRDEVLEKMIEKDAPSFELVNLKGEKVTSESLKGKVVVVDFWATWCGPCKASFPGMQQALNNYQDRNDVAFVFIDTWERGDEKEKNASEFIEKNNYTFNVLMDNENKVVADFGVTGIPTKFILDKKGKIRFKSVGFSGNNLELIRELEMMVDLAGSGANGLTGAP